MTEDHQLNERGRAWIEAIHAAYASTPLTELNAPVATTVAEVGHFKLL